MLKNSYKKLFFIIMPLYPHIPNKIFFSLKEIIYKEFINIKFNIYNGKNFSSRVINKYMIGFKIGSFILTRNKSFFKKKLKKKK